MIVYSPTAHWQPVPRKFKIMELENVMQVLRILIQKSVLLKEVSYTNVCPSRQLHIGSAINSEPDEGRG